MKEKLQQIKQRFHIVGNAPPLNRAIEVAMQVAVTDLSVLITGESGTGKESFSKIIHALSPYRHGSFIAINCGAIPEGTIDSELFGHEKGAFTGALESRKGYFEEAHGGTIFLDEIGDMPLSTQVKLLRVLECGEYVKVGSSKVERIKVRVVAATNVGLVHAIERGRFREDLYYRLNTVPITIPPLRERGCDIGLLFHKFANDFAVKHHIKPLRLHADAQVLLMQYPFPGNIRQLKNIVEQMALLEEEVVVAPAMLERYLPKTSYPILPVLYNKGESLVERELLYALLLGLKKDIAELKELMLHREKPENASLTQDYMRLLDLSNGGRHFSKPLHFLDTGQARGNGDDRPSLSCAVGENLSIEAQEQALIRKSLDKNRGNRKNTADDLGISERTLYRKIKQYEIEENSFK